MYDFGVQEVYENRKAVLEEVLAEFDNFNPEVRGHSRSREGQSNCRKFFLRDPSLLGLPC